MSTLHEWAASDGLTIDWQDNWAIGSHVAEFDTYDEEPDECLFCVVKSPDGDVLASLGCVDDPSNAYAREVERELLYEAAENVGRSHALDVALIPASELVS